MRPTIHDKPLSFYANKWGTTIPTASKYSSRGCNWDASDYDVAVWLMKYGRKKPPAMYEAIDKVPGIRDGINPEQPKPLGEIDYHAYGELMTLSCELEADVAELKEGDTQHALSLLKEVNKLDAIIDKLEGENRTL